MLEGLAKANTKVIRPGGFLPLDMLGGLAHTNLWVVGP
jgi:hypothetical protein